MPGQVCSGSITLFVLIKMEANIVWISTIFSMLIVGESEDCDIYIPPPKNIHFCFNNFELSCHWQTSESFSGFNLTYNVYSMPASGTRWQKVLQCQSLSRTSCSFPITNVFIDFWIAVALRYRNCSSAIQRASIITSPLRQIVLSPPDFNVDLLDGDWFVRPMIKDLDRGVLAMTNLSLQVQFKFPGREAQRVVASLSLSEIFLGHFQQQRGCVKVRFFNPGLINQGSSIGVGNWSQERCKENKKIAKSHNGHLAFIVGSASLFLLIFFTFVACKVQNIYRIAKEEGKSLPPELVEALRKINHQWENVDDVKETFFSVPRFHQAEFQIDIESNPSVSASEPPSKPCRVDEDRASWTGGDRSDADSSADYMLVQASGSGRLSGGYGCRVTNSNGRNQDFDNFFEANMSNASTECKNEKTNHQSPGRDQIAPNFYHRTITHLSSRNAGSSSSSVFPGNEPDHQSASPHNYVSEINMMKMAESTKKKKNLIHEV